MPGHVTAHARPQCHFTLTPFVLISFFLFFPKPAVKSQANNDACPVLRPPPLIYNSTAPFATDFTDKTQTLTFLHENYGRLYTNKVRACRRTDHLLYNTSLEGAGLSTDARGLRIVQDNIGGSVCDRNSKIATGHLLTKFYIQGGRIDLTARIGYGPEAGPGYQSEDSFSCFGLYIHDTVSQYGYRNEASMCVSSHDPTTVRMGVWNGSPADREEAKQVNVKRDLSQAFYTYSIEWGPTRVRFWLDDFLLWDMPGMSFCAGAKAAEVDKAMRNGGKGGARLPYEPMSIRIILRPLGVAYRGTSYMDVTRFAYSPLPLLKETERGSSDFLVSSPAGKKRRVEGWWWCVYGGMTLVWWCMSMWVMWVGTCI